MLFPKPELCARVLIQGSPKFHFTKHHPCFATPRQLGSDPPVPKSGEPIVTSLGQANVYILEMTTHWISVSLTCQGGKECNSSGTDCRLGTVTL